jgi:hypothetical protein
MLNYCQNPENKARIVFFSERAQVEAGFGKIASNKMVKYDILMLILDYYIAAAKWPCIQPNSKANFRDLFGQLSTLNWKQSPDEFIKYLVFMNSLIDRAIETDLMQLIYSLFIDDSQLLLKLMSIIEEITYSGIDSLYEQLSCAILRVFINLTFAFDDPRLSKIFTIASFRELILDKVNSHDFKGK